MPGDCPPPPHVSLSSTHPFTRSLNGLDPYQADGRSGQCHTVVGTGPVEMGIALGKSSAQVNRLRQEAFELNQLDEIFAGA